MKNLIRIMPLALALVMTACGGSDDPVTPEPTPTPTPTPTPDPEPTPTPEPEMTLAEKIAKYSPIKVYAQEFTPNMLMGLGANEGYYANNNGGQYRTLADENFQVLTHENGLKHSSVVQSNGSLNFNYADQLLNAMASNPSMKLYGHNFIWHTQQRQDYLLSLIKPTKGTGGDAKAVNLITGDNSDFEGSQGSWNSWGDNNPTREWASTGYNSNHCIKVTNPTANADGWKAQLAFPLESTLSTDTEYTLSFYAKTSVANDKLQFIYQRSSDYSQAGYTSFDLTTDWKKCEVKFTPTVDGANQILFNFAFVAADYYIDNVQLSYMGSSNYVLKTAAQKREALLGAMEAWIKGTADHLAEKGIVPYGYDVVNEAINDWPNTPRGFNNVFGDGDSKPSESETTGLTLNWQGDHFYWGYFIGDDYAAQAFTMARKYLPAETKLFINDYGLENKGKRDAYLAFAKEIDTKAGKTVVDGLATQMHITLGGTSDNDVNNLVNSVKESLKALAATGKLVRISELDISINTNNPTEAQLAAQYKAYRGVVEAYKEVVPQAQQSGITFWNLDDASSWIRNGSATLFDANYKRKHAYKGVCDGLAGKEIY